MYNESKSEYDQLVNVVQDWAVDRFDEDNSPLIEVRAISTVLDIVENFINPTDSSYIQELSETILDDPGVEPVILRDLALDIYSSIMSSRTSHHYIDAKPYLTDEDEVIEELMDDIPTHWEGDQPHNLH